MAIFRGSEAANEQFSTPFDELVISSFQVTNLKKQLAECGLNLPRLN